MDLKDKRNTCIIMIIKMVIAINYHEKMLANRGVTSDYIHRVLLQRHTKLNQVELDKEKYTVILQ